MYAYREYIKYLFIYLYSHLFIYLFVYLHLLSYICRSLRQIATKGSKKENGESEWGRKGREPWNGWIGKKRKKKEKERLCYQAEGGARRRNDTGL